MGLLDNYVRRAKADPQFRLVIEALDVAMKAVKIPPSLKDTTAEILLQLRQQPDTTKIEHANFGATSCVLQPILDAHARFIKEATARKVQDLKFLIFVYGSLKRGLRLNKHLKDQKFVGEAATTATYKLWTVAKCWYPFLSKRTTGGKAIQGELYEVAESCLPALDYIEGSQYQREFVSLQPPYDKELVEAYIYRYRVEEHAIDCGTNWVGEMEGLFD